MLAINVINDTSKKVDWDTHTKLIKTCEYISSLDKDGDFNVYLEKKIEEEKK